MDSIVTKKTKTEKAVEELAAAAGSSNSVVKPTTSVVKNTTKNRGKKSPKKQTRGNRFTATEKYGGGSYIDTKTRMKIYYENHPEAHIKFIEELAENAGKSPKWAALVVAMTGGTDPTETKITGEVEQIVESPLNGLTIEELRTLKALKADSKKGE